MDIIQETRNRRSQFRKKAASDLSKHPMNAEYSREPSATQNPSRTWKKAASDLNKRPMNAGYAREPSATENQANPVVQSELDIQLQASRNVRWQLYDHWACVGFAFALCLLTLH